MHTVFVPIQRVETHQETHCICGMWLRGVVWSIHRDCNSSFAFWFSTQARTVFVSILRVEKTQYAQTTGVKGCGVVVWFGKYTEIAFVVSLFGCAQAIVYLPLAPVSRRDVHPLGACFSPKGYF